MQFYATSSVRKSSASRMFRALQPGRQILRSYAGGLIEFCNQAIKLSMEVVAAWLERYMLRHEDMVVPESERAAKAAQIAEWFGISGFLR